MLAIAGEIILEGSVSSYAEKRDLETRLAALKLNIRNCLRVIPGRDDP
jgi:hypothetical protein